MRRDGAYRFLRMGRLSCAGVAGLQSVWRVEIVNVLHDTGSDGRESTVRY